MRAAAQKLYDLASAPPYDKLGEQKNNLTDTVAEILNNAHVGGLSTTANKLCRSVNDKSRSECNEDALVIAAKNFRELLRVHNSDDISQKYILERYDPRFPNYQNR